MNRKQKILTGVFIFILIFALFSIVLKPYFASKLLSAAKQYTRGRYICTLDNKGRHTGKLYRINGNKQELVHTSISNSCIFSRPKINAGFFVFAIGGGGGATPYESGTAGQIISKHKSINKPVITIKIGKGGHGTYLSDKDIFVDAKDGEDTTIEDLKITASGGRRSMRMTPAGSTVKTIEYHIPDKYHYLYDIPKNAKYGAGGQFDKDTKDTSAKAQNGHSGAVIIQW